ncbi:MAG: SUMF1/EgtB/PvdO family nonheme iron enzyme [Succinivibrio sp.]|nr:SUMF1/EgtB/PvdO family nonheme iron enzyme [Succinivibrio sp.]
MQSYAASIFNPQPLEGDLSLPLPCLTPNPEYQIVFRKVYTHSTLDQDATHSFEFNDGTLNYGNAAIQAPRKCQVRGNFRDKYGSFFYLAKYELTEGQYDAIVNHKCPAHPTKLAALAKGGISIDEAREVARLYSDFLQTLPDTPKVGTELASATLPYECYWSFAQRGGLLVTREQLQSDLPYLGAAHTLKDYAWGFGADSANGKIQLIGRKIPNALGFFDLLGNVQEYIDEPFQATNTEGLSGQKGGSTVRGGSILTPFNQLSSSLRTEKKRYTKHLPTRPKDTGMRLMLNVSVTLDAHHLKELEQAVRRQQQPVAPAQSQPEDKPLSTKEQDAALERSAIKEAQDRQEQAETAVARVEAEPQTEAAKSAQDLVVTIDTGAAHQHLNQYATVCGKIVQLTKFANLIYLNFDNHFPYQTFTVLLTNAEPYGDVKSLINQKVCATGVIKEYQQIPRISNPVKLQVQSY